MALSSYKPHLIIFLFVLFISCSDKSSNNTDKLVERAVILEGKKEYGQAFDFLNKAILSDSLEPMLYVIRGRLYISQNRCLDAIIDLKHAISLNTRLTASYYYIGIANSCLDREQDAIYYFSKAIESKKNGNFIIEDQNIDKFSYKNQTDVPLNVLKFHRGISYFKQDNDSLSIEDLKYSSSYDYHKDEALLYLGIIYLSTESNDACKYFKLTAQLGNNEAKEYFAKFCKD